MSRLPQSLIGKVTVTASYFNSHKGSTGNVFSFMSGSRAVGCGGCCFVAASLGLKSLPFSGAAEVKRRGFQGMFCTCPG